MGIGVLLVEDNDLNRDMLSRRLTRAGYVVRTATDGEEALAKVRELRPDVVLLDLSLPVKDGWATCEEIRADARISATAIIALTAHAMSDDRKRALAAGCNDYAPKPVDFPELLEKIEKITAVGRPR
ncbi:MAG: response regulator [Halieaceae bacterium]|nr:response regulator [Halieaceae bacterium]